MVRVSGYIFRGPDSIPAAASVLRRSGSGTESTSTIEELLGRESSGSGLENRDYGRRESTKLAITLPTNGGLSFGIVRSWTEATELVTYRNY
jgi:hypothetical protein